MIKSAPGCLGIETGQAQSQKLVIFAWFKDRASARAWYAGGAPAMIRGMAKLPQSNAVPLKTVKDGVPVLIALSFGAPPETKKPTSGDAPFGSVSIEFYTPAPGGFALVNRFAPDSVRVPGLAYQKAPAPSKNAASGKAGKSGSIFNTDLVGALKASPGCVGADALKLPGGKLAIAAWFKNKAAVMNWYGSVSHGKMMAAMPPPTRAPLSKVTDDRTPILVVASLTPATDAKKGVAGMPVSQIAIELYYVADGGFSAGGTLAPKSLAIPGLERK